MGAGAHPRHRDQRPPRSPPNLLPPDSGGAAKLYPVARSGPHAPPLRPGPARAAQTHRAPLRVHRRLHARVAHRSGIHDAGAAAPGVVGHAAGNGLGVLVSGPQERRARFWREAEGGLHLLPRLHPHRRAVPPGRPVPMDGGYPCPPGGTRTGPCNCEAARRLMARRAPDARRCLRLPSRACGGRHARAAAARAGGGRPGSRGRTAAAPERLIRSRQTAPERRGGHRLGGGRARRLRAHAASLRSAGDDRPRSCARRPSLLRARPAPPAP